MFPAGSGRSVREHGMCFGGGGRAPSGHRHSTPEQGIEAPNADMGPCDESGLQKAQSSPEHKTKNFPNVEKQQENNSSVLAKLH